MIRQFLSGQFLRFLVTGGLAALVNFVVRWLLDPFLGFSWAVIVAFPAGMATAYVLARRFVFAPESGTLTGRSAWRFTVVNGLAALQTWGVSMLLYHGVLPWAGVEAHAAEIAHGVGIIVPVFSSYIGHKYWSFR